MSDVDLQKYYIKSNQEREERLRQESMKLEKEALKRQEEDKIYRQLEETKKEV